MTGQRQQQKDATRRRILEHARSTLISGGPEAVTIAPLMAALGLTHGGFYAHFESREQLLDAVVKELCSTVTAGFDKTAEKQTPERALLAYVELYLSELHRDTTEWGCALAYLTNDIPKLSSASRGEYAAAYGKLTLAFSGMLRRAGVRAPSSIAISLVSELVGTVSISRALPDPTESAKVLSAARKIMKDRIRDLIRNTSPLS